VQTEVKLNKKDGVKKSPPASARAAEDSIPVIEIKGEGKPMTAAQIRALEEEAEGKPLDIKIKKTWMPKDCAKKAKRRDFVTFHYKGFMEDGRKFDQSYGKDPIRMQLGVGMTMPGLDKGLRGMCETELRKIHIPWRLSRKKKSKVWKNVPNEEHWIVFDVEVLRVEPWTPELQFQYMDANNDSQLTATELAKHVEKVRKEFGKAWPNPDIDTMLAAKYFVRYFDTDNNGKVSLDEYWRRISADEELSKSAQASKNKKNVGRKRDPGVGWILDFDNDGFVDMSETDAAADLLEGDSAAITEWVQAKRRNETESGNAKDEL